MARTRRAKSHCVGRVKKSCQKMPDCKRTRSSAKRRSYCRKRTSKRH